MSFISDLTTSTRRDGLAGAVLSIHRSLKSDVGLFDLNGNLLATAPQRTLWDYEQVLTARAERSELPMTVQAIESGGEVVALLAVGASGVDQTLLGITADVISLEIGRVRAGDEGRRALATTVLKDIILNKVPDSEASAGMRRVGLNPTQPVRVLLGWSEYRSDTINMVPWNLSTLVSEVSDSLVRVVLDDYVMMVVPDDPMIMRIADTLLRHMAGLGPSATVGVSFAHVGPSGLRVGFYEALTAVREGNGVRLPERLDFARLLVITNQIAPVGQVARRLLWPLLEYDRTRGGSLVLTLRRYLECNRGVVEAAQRLSIHRNTMRYRLGQIRDLLDFDTESTWAITNLWLALIAIEDRSDDLFKEPGTP